VEKIPKSETGKNQKHAFTGKQANKNKQNRTTKQGI
tara:strand:+ start:202 stop:309 length:108 start_codon:yes stop_codon:yes gene_type:complete